MNGFIDFSSISQEVLKVIECLLGAISIIFVVAAIGLDAAAVFPTVSIVTFTVLIGFGNVLTYILSGEINGAAIAWDLMLLGLTGFAAFAAASGSKKGAAQLSLLSIVLTFWTAFSRGSLPPAAIRFFQDVFSQFSGLASILLTLFFLWIAARMILGIGRR